MFALSLPITSFAFVSVVESKSAANSSAKEGIDCVKDCCHTFWMTDIYKIFVGVIVNCFGDQQSSHYCARSFHKCCKVSFCTRPVWWWPKLSWDYLWLWPFWLIILFSSFCGMEGGLSLWSLYFEILFTAGCFNDVWYRLFSIYNGFSPSVSQDGHF